MWIVSVDVWVPTVVHFLVKKEKRGVWYLNEYGNTYGRMVKNAPKQLVLDVTEFVTPCLWEKITVKEEVLGGRERREAVKGTSRTATYVQVLPWVRKAFISMNEK